MPKTYRVGIIGSGHMQIHNVAQPYSAHPQVQGVGCADTVPLRPDGGKRSLSDSLPLAPMLLAVHRAHESLPNQRMKAFGQLRAPGAFPLCLYA